MLTKTILAELIAATSTPRGKRDTHEKHLQKLIAEVGALDDDAWDALSDPAAEWYNAAVQAVNVGEAIPGADKDPMEAETNLKQTGRTRAGRSNNSKTEDVTMKKVLLAIAMAEVVKATTVVVTCGDDTFTGEVINVVKKGRGAKATVTEFTIKTADGEEVFGTDDLLFDEGDKIEREDEVEDAPADKPAGRSSRRGKKDEAKDDKPAGRSSRRGKKDEAAKDEPAEPVEVRTEIEFNAIVKGNQLELVVEDETFLGEATKVTKKGRGAKAAVTAIEITTDAGVEAFDAENIVIEEGDKITLITMEAPKADAGKKAGRGKSAKAGKSAATGESAASQVRRILCENLDADKKEIEGLVSEAGIEMKTSTLDVLFSEAHNLISVLRDLGMIVEE